MTDVFSPLINQEKKNYSDRKYVLKQTQNIGNFLNEKKTNYITPFPALFLPYRNVRYTNLTILSLVFHVFTIWLH